MKNSSLDENHRKYLANLAGRNGSPPPNGESPTIDQLAREGELLLSDKNPTPIPTDKTNAYLRGREKALGEMSSERRARILDMEARGATDNASYDELVRLTAKYGDQFHG
jgi:hypothetical protein